MNLIRRNGDDNFKQNYKSLSAMHNMDMEGSISAMHTSEALANCKTQIIRPFNIMLTMVGWRSLTTQLQYSGKYLFLLKCLDKTILFIFIFLLLFSYAYQLLACRFKNTGPYQMTTIGPLGTTLPSVRNLTTARMRFFRGYTTSLIPDNESTDDSIVCHHLWTTYVFPNCLHFVAYVLGLIHYRYKENEDVYGLMEKTVQYSETIGGQRKNYFKVSKKLKVWTLLAGSWVLLATINLVLYDVAYNTYISPRYIFKINPNDEIKILKHALYALDFFGYIIESVVTVAIVLNYTIYCELVKFYVYAISRKIEMRCIKMNVLRNDIHNVGGMIDLINGMIGRMMSLIFVLEIFVLIVGVNNLIVLEKGGKLEIAFRIYFVLYLIPLILTALFQCVRVNFAMETFRVWGRHMSVYGYRKETRHELDSFLLFSMEFNPKARITGLPLEHRHVITFFLFLSIIIVILIQTDAMEQSFFFKAL